MPQEKNTSSALDSKGEETVFGSKPYLIPFQFAIRELGLKSDVPDRFEITRDQLNAFTTSLLRGVAIDEQGYLDRYPDIKVAIERGDIPSAREHFVAHGYIEGRYADRVLVDDSFYLTTYPDIAEGIEMEDIRSAQEHFDNHGRGEGRLPYRS